MIEQINRLLLVHTLRVHYAHAAANLRSEFRILKILEGSARALFLYICTPNTSRARELALGVLTREKD